MMDGVGAVVDGVLILEEERSRMSRCKRGEKCVMV